MAGQGKFLYEHNLQAKKTGHKFGIYPRKTAAFFSALPSGMVNGRIAKPELRPDRDRELYQNGKHCFNGNTAKPVFFAPALAI